MPRQKRATAAGAVGYAIVAGVVGLGLYSYQRESLARQGWSEVSRYPGLTPAVRPVTPALSISPGSGRGASPATSPRRRGLGRLFSR